MEIMSQLRGRARQQERGGMDRKVERGWGGKEGGRQAGRQAGREGGREGGMERGREGGKKKREGWRLCALLARLAALVAPRVHAVTARGQQLDSARLA